jgi:Fe-S cluster assembly ATP-binding protein
VAILDETDSGLDVDAIRVVYEGVKKLRNENNAFIIITHYNKVLEYLEPDFVHVLHQGKIVKSGGIEVANEIEKQGYKGIKEEN